MGRAKSDEARLSVACSCMTEAHATMPHGRSSSRIQLAHLGEVFSQQLKRPALPVEPRRQVLNLYALPDGKHRDELRLWLTC